MAVARVMERPVCDQAPEYMEIHKDPVSPILPSLTAGDDQPKKYITDFDETEFSLCRQHFYRPDDLLLRDFTTWLQVKRDGKKCLITCRVCKHYFESSWRPDKKQKQFIQKEGYWSEKIYENKGAVKEHLKESIHAEAAYFYSRLESASTRAEQLRIEESQKMIEKIRLRPSMNEVRLGYTEIRSEVPFSKHGTFMNSAEELGVNVGFKHRNEKSLTLLAVTISQCFYKNLLEHLVEQKICDGTTNKNIPYLVGLIQTLEDGRPIVYFWGIFCLQLEKLVIAWSKI